MYRVNCHVIGFIRRVYPVVVVIVVLESLILLTFSLVIHVGTLQDRDIHRELKFAKFSIVKNRENPHPLKIFTTGAI